MKKLLLVCICLTGVANAMNADLATVKALKNVSQRGTIGEAIRAQQQNYHSIDIDSGHPVADVEMSYDRAMHRSDMMMGNLLVKAGMCAVGCICLYLYYTASSH